jgi:eukaryotic-like serine/threonine-protein kinase
VRVEGLLQPGDPEFIGPYRVVKPLGRGGMGRVFLAVSPGGRPVAVKVVHPEYAGDPEFRTRFRREVEAARKVSGSRTAEVVDADTDGPVPWLATVYVPGPSLKQAVKEHGPLPLPSLIALAAGLAEGIGVIHAAGVVHRDLTSNNVLIAEDGPRIIDFGISQAADATMHTHSTRFGTPGYHPPELLASSGQVAAAEDIFSLGAVLAFAATGTNPFGSGPSEALAYRVLHEEPDLTGVPAEISDLIQRCLAKDPAKRPTAAEVLTELASAGPKMGWLPGHYVVPAQATWTAPVTATRPSFPSARDTVAITTAVVLGFLVVTSIALMETAGIGGSTTGRIPVGLIGGYSAVSLSSNFPLTRSTRSAFSALAEPSRPSRPPASASAITWA